MDLDYELGIEKSSVGLIGFMFSRHSNNFFKGRCRHWTYWVSAAIIGTAAFLIISQGWVHFVEALFVQHPESLKLTIDIVQDPVGCPMADWVPMPSAAV